MERKPTSAAFAVRIAVILGVCGLAGCGGDSDPVPTSPPAFSYNGSHPFPAVVGEAIALTPAVSGPVDRFTVDPALPPGLSLNGATGVISGTPVRATAPQNFAVTATNPAGQGAFTLTLSVTEPPSNLSYSSPAEGRVGTALAPLRPRHRGTIDHYAVRPALPRGLELDTSSGLITGTPRAASKLAPYTITASSLSGSTSFVLLLTVRASQARGRD
jgi:hypothetical protein